MLEVLIGEASKGYKNKEYDTEQQKKLINMKMKRFHYDRQLQIYMYAFMYVDPETMSDED